MTSPHPPRAPDRESTERPALAPSLKLFLATTILCIGSAVALACAKPRPEPSGGANPVPVAAAPSVSAAPAPNVVQTVAAPIPPTAPPPSVVDSGNEKYAQAYPPPILNDAVVPPKRKSQRKASRSAGKSGNPFRKIDTQFEPVREFSALPPVELEEGRDVFKLQPETVSATRLSDSLLPLFHFADNFKPISLEDEEPKPPENPFQAAPSDPSESEIAGKIGNNALEAATPTENRTSLIPLRTRDAPAKNSAGLIPLRPLTSREQLKPLPPLSFRQKVSDPFRLPAKAHLTGTPGSRRV